MRPRATNAPKRASAARAARVVARYAARLAADDVALDYLRKACTLEEGIDTDTLAGAYHQREIGLLGIRATDPDAIKRLKASQ